MPDLFSSSIRRQAEKPDRRISCPSSHLKTYPAIIANASPKKSAPASHWRRFVGFSRSAPFLPVSDTHRPFVKSLTERRVFLR